MDGHTYIERDIHNNMYLYVGMKIITMVYMTIIIKRKRKTITERERWGVGYFGGGVDVIWKASIQGNKIHHLKYIKFFITRKSQTYSRRIPQSIIILDFQFYNRKMMKKKKEEKKFFKKIKIPSVYW